MFRKTILPGLLALACLPLAAVAAEVDSGSVYCFGSQDFSGAGQGICIRSVPEAGELTLGSRVLAPGDVLTLDQMAAMTYTPRDTETDESVLVGYLPIGDGVGEEAVLTISVRGKEDKAPVAEDTALETYKNLETTGKLKASDPEGQALTYTVVRQPKRGSVTIGPDGTFTYTPKKNKVGVDSFVYTAADPAGKVSREATVTITILKPTEATQYQDLAGRECRFAAEWMKQTGIFTGETLAGSPAFNPDKPVTRGEFLTMLVKTLNIPQEEEISHTGYTDEVPGWLQPYLAAAVRSGLTAKLPDQETFGAQEPITGAEAAVLVCAGLDLSPETLQTGAEETHWAADALGALADKGFPLEAEATMTRGQTARLLYEASRLMEEKSVFTQ